MSVDAVDMVPPHHRPRRLTLSDTSTHSEHSSSTTNSVTHSVTVGNDTVGGGPEASETKRGPAENAAHATLPWEEAQEQRGSSQSPALHSRRIEYNADAADVAWLEAHPRYGMAAPAMQRIDLALFELLIDVLEKAMEQRKGVLLGEDEASQILLAAVPAPRRTAFISLGKTYCSELVSDLYVWWTSKPTTRSSRGQVAELRQMDVVADYSSQGLAAGGTLGAVTASGATSSLSSGKMKMKAIQEQKSSGERPRRLTLSDASTHSEHFSSAANCVTHSVTAGDESATADAAPTGASDDAASAPRPTHVFHPELLRTLQDALESHDAKSLVKSLEKHVGADDVSKREFRFALADITGMDGHDDEVRTLFMQLFEIMDNDHSGSLSYDEMACGFGSFCTDSPSETAHMAFHVFDYEKTNLLSKDEMQMYLASTYRMLNAVEGITEDVEQFSKSAAKQCFQHFTIASKALPEYIPVNSITLKQFTKWLGDPAGAIDEKLLTLERERREHLAVRDVVELSTVDNTLVVNSSSSVVDVTRVWTRHYSETHAAYFYVHTLNGESVWDAPPSHTITHPDFAEPTRPPSPQQRRNRRASQIPPKGAGVPVGASSFTGEDSSSRSRSDETTTTTTTMVLASTQIAETQHMVELLAEQGRATHDSIASLITQLRDGSTAPVTNSTSKAERQRESRAIETQKMVVQLTEQSRTTQESIAQLLLAEKGRATHDSIATDTIITQLHDSSSSPARTSTSEAVELGRESQGPKYGGDDHNDIIDIDNMFVGINIERIEHKFFESICSKLLESNRITRREYDEQMRVHGCAELRALFESNQISRREYDDQIRAHRYDVAAFDNKGGRAFPIENLTKRFCPPLEPAMIARALAECDGHAGHASKLLRELSNEIASSGGGGGGGGAGSYNRLALDERGSDANGDQIRGGRLLREEHLLRDDGYERRGAARERGGDSGDGVRDRTCDRMSDFAAAYNRLALDERGSDANGNQARGARLLRADEYERRGAALERVEDSGNGARDSLALGAARAARAEWSGSDLRTDFHLKRSTSSLTQTQVRAQQRNSGRRNPLPKSYSYSAAEVEVEVGPEWGGPDTRTDATTERLLEASELRYLGDSTRSCSSLRDEIAVLKRRTETLNQRQDVRSRAGGASASPSSSSTRMGQMYASQRTQHTIPALSTAQELQEPGVEYEEVKLSLSIPKGFHISQVHCSPPNSKLLQEVTLQRAS